jgi:hypothetical protein
MNEAMPLDNFPSIPPLHYLRIDLIFSTDHLQGLPHPVQHRLSHWLRARLAADTPPAPAPTAIHPTYGPVEGYLLYPRLVGHSPAPFYPTVFLRVLCVREGDVGRDLPA